MERPKQCLFHKALNAHSKTPLESFYLELGIMLLRFHLMKRRILYFHDIKKRADTGLTTMVFLSRKDTRIKGDFYVHVENDMMYKKTL